jgi:hypothetical protein
MAILLSPQLLLLSSESAARAEPCAVVNEGSKSCILAPEFLLVGTRAVEMASEEINEGDIMLSQAR